jgi:hypothetical protein
VATDLDIALENTFNQMRHGTQHHTLPLSGSRKGILRISLILQDERYEKKKKNKQKKNILEPE